MFLSLKLEQDVFCCHVSTMSLLFTNDAEWQIVHIYCLSAGQDKKKVLKKNVKYLSLYV